MALHPIKLKSIVLIGAREEVLGRDSTDDLFLRGDDKSVMKTMYTHRDEIRLIQEHFNFNEEGYSSEIRHVFNFWKEGDHVYHAPNGPGVYICKGSEVNGRIALEYGEISQEDFDALANIGRQLVRKF